MLALMFHCVMRGLNLHLSFLRRHILQQCWARRENGILFKKWRNVARQPICLSIVIFEPCFSDAASKEIRTVIRVHCLMIRPFYFKALLIPGKLLTHENDGTNCVCRKIAGRKAPLWWKAIQYFDSKLVNRAYAASVPNSFVVFHAAWLRSL